MSDRRHEENSSSSRHKRNPLPPLAPRDVRPTSSPRDRSSEASSSGRPPRLSHRSRAGCWTCRGRKVKCDETHPRCGPCTRLNRECDWDHRWNFNDSVQVVQSKYSNVTTSGNAVWDPSARSSSSPVPQEQDDLPEFASLTTDEDRERKACTQRPGTFAVVATPESFYDLPEYASVGRSNSRRTSAASSRGGYGSPRGSLTRARTLPLPLPDPNTVVLDRFEDAPSLPIGSFTITPGSRRGSFPETLDQLSITTPPYAPSTASAPPTPIRRPDDHLLVHFRQYIVPRLIQPQQDLPSHGATQDVLGTEAARFAPLHHAICAVSALGLAYSGRASMEESMQHYHQALAAQSTGTSPNDLIQDGVFLRHFLLLVYDICIPMEAEDSSADSLWAGHLNHLRHIATQRHQSRGREPHGHILWTICELDMYACLMGSGNCDFVQTITSQTMLPPLDQQVPGILTGHTSGTIPYLPHEMHIFPPVLHLKEGIVLRTAKLAQVAQTFRAEASSQQPASPGTYARWQANVMQLQTDLQNFWQQAYPEHLGPESQAGQGLPGRVRSVFENALLLYHASTIYARTSMFPNQRLIPTASQTEVLADTDRRIRLILSLASQVVESGRFEKRHVIFPVFMAGFATNSPDLKLHAIELIRAFEGKGIGQNTYRTRQLLVAVCEEQRRVKERGGRMEDVQWMGVAREKGLEVVNCGL